MSAAVVDMRELARRGHATKALRSRQRAALRGRPPALIAAVIVNPPRELATYRLRLLFGPPACRGERGLIPGLGESRLRSVLRRLSLDPDVQRNDWNPELRLNELTPGERVHLALALIAAAPPSWRDGHTTSTPDPIPLERNAS